MIIFKHFRNLINGKPGKKESRVKGNIKEWNCWVFNKREFGLLSEIGKTEKKDSIILRIWPCFFIISFENYFVWDKEKVWTWTESPTNEVWCSCMDLPFDLYLRKTKLCFFETFSKKNPSNSIKCRPLLKETLRNPSSERFEWLRSFMIFGYYRTKTFDLCLMNGKPSSAFSIFCKKIKREFPKNNLLPIDKISMFLPFASAMSWFGKNSNSSVLNDFVRVMILFTS